MPFTSSSSSSSPLPLLHLPSPARPPSALQFHTCKFGFASDNEGTSVLGPKTKSRAFQMVVSATKNSTKEVTVVDPLEAKRLAEKQMQQIRAKEKYRRKREIEALNGGWAMIGLTAGLVIESHTGNGILKQGKITIEYSWHDEAKSNSVPKYESRRAILITSHCQRVWRRYNLGVFPCSWIRPGLCTSASNSAASSSHLVGALAVIAGLYIVLWGKAKETLLT